MTTHAGTPPRLPRYMARLPLDHAGRPIPWFVAELADGTRDPRVADGAKRRQAHRDKLCWVCGNPRGVFQAFVLGPMCAVNRVTAEPPCHRDCAVYSALACPFLSTPQMVRRERGKLSYDDGRVDPPGVMITSNPGVTAVWITRTSSLVDVGNGSLWSVGDPTDVQWYTQGAKATREQAVASLVSGRPLLEEACHREKDPAAALAQMEACYARALLLLPPT